MVKVPVDRTQNNIAWISNFKFDFERKSFQKSKAQSSGNKYQNNICKGTTQGTDIYPSAETTGTEMAVRTVTGIKTGIQIVPQMETATGLTSLWQTEAGIGLVQTTMEGNHVVQNTRIVM